MAIKGVLIIILVFLLAAPAHAQCSSPINSFPYLQDFELNDGGWVPENSLHWNYGSISGKPVISTAASGTRCWVAGSLSTNSYNAGVSSLTSPCTWMEDTGGGPGTGSAARADSFGFLFRTMYLSLMLQVSPLSFNTKSRTSARSAR